MSTAPQTLDYSYLVAGSGKWGRMWGLGGGGRLQELRQSAGRPPLQPGDRPGGVQPRPDLPDGGRQPQLGGDGGRGEHDNPGTVWLCPASYLTKPYS